MLLSILTPTQHKNFNYLNRLQNIILPQIEKYPGQIEHIYDYSIDPTGTKRNELLSRARGKYVVSIDDDDIISTTYIQDIMQAIEQGPDVITFCGWMTTDGVSRVDFVIKLGEAYEERGGKYYRFPNHLAVMRRDLVKDFKFLPVTQGEDYAWALDIHNAGVLKTEVHIDRELYHYDFRSRK